MTTLGIDFDGVLRKYPAPFQAYYNFISPYDLLIRARLHNLRSKIRSWIANHTPMCLNGELIALINQNYREARKLIVSGRCYLRCQIEAISAIYGFLDFEQVIFKEDCSEFEERFKRRIIKQEKIDMYIEDRRFVRWFLSQTTNITILSPEEFIEHQRRKI